MEARGGVLSENTLCSFKGCFLIKRGFQGRDPPTHQLTVESTLLLFDFRWVFFAKDRLLQNAKFYAKSNPVSF